MNLSPGKKVKKLIFIELQMKNSCVNTITEQTDVPHKKKQKQKKQGRKMSC